MNAMSDESIMHAPGGSDDCVIPGRVPNKGPQGPAEGSEGRRSIKENTEKANPSRIQGREIGSRGLLGVREAAKRDKELRFTALLHHVTEGLLLDSYYSLKRKAAPGVDGVTWQEYEQGVEARIKDLHGRVQRGAYRAKPSRRMYIEKGDGRQRPLGIAALEDKIVQQAVVTVLNAIYEEDFIGFSYGFRLGKGCHDALDALTAGIVGKKVDWILDADVRGFFDNLSHEYLMQLIQKRVGDPRILRLIQKWLKAGVSEEGEWSETTVGVPQGAVASPLLANIYLHYVLDQWVVWWRKRYACGDLIIVRYADDFVIGFQHRKVADRFLKELRERMQGFGLELHPEKTRLIEFGRYAIEHRQRNGEGKPETFNFLGFTHICGSTHKTGRFAVMRKTIGKRMAAKLKAIKAELRKRMHEPIKDTGEWLRTVVRGYYNYYAVPGNFPRMRSFRHDVIRSWWQAVRRRSQRALRREAFDRIVALYIPAARIVHPYPLERFCAKHPR
jgi:group II intron reverse transcriptase/maturase